MEEKAKSTPAQEPDFISLEELRVRIHHPPPADNPYFHDPRTENSLSSIPWTFRQSVTIHTDERRRGSSHKFPDFSYLDLRRHQNRAWANDRLAKGNDEYYLNAEKADSFYQEGIDLVPDHVDLLVAQAKLWLLRRNRPMAAKRQLEEALQYDPTHPQATELMAFFDRHEKARRGVEVKRSKPQMRESSAYQDVLMERNLAIESASEVLAKGGDDDDNDDSVASDHSSRRRRSKKNKKRKRKKKSKKSKKDSKKRRKRRRRRYDSSSSSSRNDGDDSCSVGSDVSADRHQGEEISRKKTRKHKRRIRKDSELSLDDKGINETGIAIEPPHRHDRDTNSEDSNIPRKSRNEKDGKRHHRRHDTSSEGEESSLGAKNKSNSPSQMVEQKDGS